MTGGDAGLLKDLQTVLTVSRALGAERDLDRLLALIVRSVTDLVAAERTSLFVVDHARHQLWTRVAEGSGEIRLPLGKGIAGTVAASGQVINIPSAYDDPRFDSGHDRATGFRTTSILCMPLVNHEQTVVGVIQALNQRDGRPFDQRDEQVLAALCAQAGVALDQAQLIARDRERQRLLQEMELARSIQLSLLPECVPEVSGWRFSAWCRSCDQTGGDYYDFMLTSSGAIDAVVGDVSGHGIAAAMLMSTARAFLRALHQHADQPGPLMGRLNTLLAQDMADDAFMTMVLCRLGADGSLSFVSAGHEPPMVWRAAGKSFDELESTGLALGMLEDGDFGTTAVPALQPGDIVVLLTDGIVEAHAPPRQELFGNDRLRALIAGAAAGGADAVREAVVRAVEAWMGDTSPHDDMTLVVCQRT